MRTRCSPPRRPRRRTTSCSALPKGYDTRVEQRGDQFVRRAETTPRDRARAVAAAADTDPGRQHQRGRCGHRDAHPGGAGNADCAGSTVLIVAQRISTVLNADKIIVLDKGRMAAQGTHKTLMQTSPIYREIYDSQLGRRTAGSRPSRSACRLQAVLHHECASSVRATLRRGEARASAAPRNPMMPGRIETRQESARHAAPAGRLFRPLQTAAGAGAGADRGLHTCSVCSGRI